MATDVCPVPVFVPFHLLVPTCSPAQYPKHLPSCPLLVPFSFLSPALFFSVHRHCTFLYPNFLLPVPQPFHFSAPVLFPSWPNLCSFLSPTLSSSVAIHLHVLDVVLSCPQTSLFLVPTHKLSYYHTFYLPILILLPSCPHMLICSCPQTSHLAVCHSCTFQSTTLSNSCPLCWFFPLPLIATILIPSCPYSSLFDICSSSSPHPSVYFIVISDSILAVHVCLITIFCSPHSFFLFLFLLLSVPIPISYHHHPHPSPIHPLIFSSAFSSPFYSHTSFLSSTLSEVSGFDPCIVEHSVSRWPGGSGIVWGVEVTLIKQESVHILCNPEGDISYHCLLLVTSRWHPHKTHMPLMIKRRRYGEDK